MAEVVFNLAIQLTEKLGSLAYEEICLAWGVKPDLQKLASTMSTIKSALMHAEEKQAHNAELRSWLQQLKDVFRDAEDVLDEFECEALKRQVVKTYYSTGRKVRRFFSHSNPIAFRLRVGHEIKSIRERIEELKANKAMFDLLIDHQIDHDHDRQEPRGIMKENMTHSFIPASEVIGRDSDKEKIVDLLLHQTVDHQSGNSQSSVSVIPIVGLGGLDEREWKLIRDSKIWELEREKEGGGHIIPALRLSYTQLPSYLKPCLAYCAYLLPKDASPAHSRELIKCWMAHGILQPRDNVNLEMEDVGEQYFKELCARSFFENVQVIEDEYDTCFQFSMHDLIYDLVQSIEQGEWCVVDSSTKYMAENVKHLSFLKFDNKLMFSPMLQKLKKVRSITANKAALDESFLDTCFSNFEYLRVLRIGALSLKELPSSIGTLKHLRYLNLWGNDEIIKLPNAICRLQSLQTLYLGCENLQELPSDISNLISLRSLALTTNQPCFQNNGVGCLKSLWLLAIVSCSNLISLPHEMIYLGGLRILIISDCEQLDLMNQHYQVIELRLEKLVIDELPLITELPEWFQGAANTLQYLYIQNCSNLSSLPGWLTNLTLLRKLVVDKCPKLLSLPKGMHRLTALRELQIKHCPELVRRCKRDTGEDWLQISDIPNLSIF
ncbi:hypothetical protein M0R45_030433 [Rubus argutus]|uniref:Uncharacterized protein n=1 Tax=Rubus argutus TaxID=59490 RepID=A0AAW1WBH1_RUBAR